MANILNTRSPTISEETMIDSRIPAMIATPDRFNVWLVSIATDEKSEIKPIALTVRQTARLDNMDPVAQDAFLFRMWSRR